MLENNTKEPTKEGEGNGRDEKEEIMHCFELGPQYRFENQRKRYKTYTCCKNFSL